MNPDWAIVFKRQIKETTSRNYLPIWNASCVELTYKGYGTSGTDSNETFKGCMVFVITEQFTIQL